MRIGDIFDYPYREVWPTMDAMSSGSAPDSSCTAQTCPSRTASAPTGSPAIGWNVTSPRPPVSPTTTWRSLWEAQPPAFSAWMASNASHRRHCQHACPRKPKDSCGVYRAAIRHRRLCNHQWDTYLGGSQPSMSRHHRMHLFFSQGRPVVQQRVPCGQHKRVPHAIARFVRQLSQP